MEKPQRSRAGTLLQLLEKLHGKSVKRQSPEDVQQLRNTTSKIQQLIATQDKVLKDIIWKDSTNLHALLSVIEYSADAQVLLNVVSTFSDLLGKVQFGKKAGILVSCGAVNLLFKALVFVSQNLDDEEELIIVIHHLLSKIGAKDRKFGVKARLNKALSVTLNCIKNNLSYLKIQQSLLQVFKLYTINNVNASYLGKQNCIPHIFRIMSHCGRKYTIVLKLCLDILCNLTKSKSNAARVVGMGGIPNLLTLNSDWHSIDNKHKHISMRKSILNVLKNVTNLRAGRKEFADANGIKILYDCCQDVIETREMESLILLASIIMRKCCPRNKLPLEDIRSPVTYPLPHSDLYTPEGATYTEGTAGMGAGTDSESDHSSLDDDDDIDSDDEQFKTDNTEEPEEDNSDNINVPHGRSQEDLKMYEKFYPELIEFQVPNAESPSGMSDGYFSRQNEERYAVQRSRSEEPTSKTYSGFYHGSTAAASSGSVTDSGISSGSMSHVSDVSDSTTSSVRKCQSATAINMKTGASIFSLDIHLPSSSTTALIPNAKPKKYKSSKKLQAREKKSKRPQQDYFIDELCITPLESPRNCPTPYKPKLQDDCDNTVVEGDPLHTAAMYMEMAPRTNSVYKFDKLAYPDLHGCKGKPEVEQLYKRKLGVQRSKIFEDINRMIQPEHIIDRVIYNLDNVIRTNPGLRNINQDINHMPNRDELRAGKPDMGADCLRFNSQFESGNLRKVIQIRDHEYDLILNPDVNTNHHHQWFYFEVSNMRADVRYRFNIVNCEKLNSQLNFGMKPLLFSVTEASQGRPYWTRKGSAICYYKNHYNRSPAAAEGAKGKAYYTGTFTITFQHDRDVCYMAYHYPYTYTTLQTNIKNWTTAHDSNSIYYKHQTLCETIAGNIVPVLTITARPESQDGECIRKFRSRPYIFLSARVHPGESNSSWVMKGIIDYLLSEKPAAQNLRELFIFKIVPMLNPDGVINGNHRCSLVAEDLNRRWMLPCSKLHPTIYHAKGLLQYLLLINKAPLVFCDLHGHSRRKNIFLYGCAPSLSWIANDTQNPSVKPNQQEDTSYQILPRLLNFLAPAFCLQNCSYVVEKTKESCARVVVWRQMGVIRSYTMESSYCGFDQGKYKDVHISTSIMEETGQKFCESLRHLVKGKYAADYTANLPENLGANLPERSETEESRSFKNTSEDSIHTSPEDDIDLDNLSAYDKDEIMSDESLDSDFDIFKDD